MQIENLKKKKILVAGDFMLDVYTMGEVHRISPEAPVPVLRVSEESHLPGGAGNTILNLVSLGMDVVALGRVGDDDGGKFFLQELVKEKVDISGIFCDSTFQTPLKKRMIASGQQIVRIDYELFSVLSRSVERQIILQLPQLLDRVDVVAISDYAKGFLTPSLLSELIRLARTRSIPVIVDPKGMDFTRYEGATLIKPNYTEAVHAAGLGVEASLDEIAEQILRDVAIDMLMVTRSKEGISIFSRTQPRQDFAARIHEVKDVTGAGDTVLAIITAAMANQISIGEGAKLANIAASIAIERIGCARISLADIASRFHEERESVLSS